MARIMVTGGTGLIGSNVCRLLVEAGDEVVALVRPGSDSGPLAAIGTELYEGDLTVADDVLQAAKGCDAIVNSAAVLGGNEQDLEEQQATNIDGAAHAFDAGAALGVRVVNLSTTTFFRHGTSLTEDSPMADDWSEDPYTRTKGAAYADTMRRVDEGADIVVVIPGGTFGPGLSVSRSLSRTSYNRAVRAAVQGKISEYVSYPVPWVFAEDVAAATVAAITKGERGRKYLAFGQEDAQSTAAFLNVACEVAGVRQRVTDITIDAADPDALARYGPSLLSLAQRRFPVPWFDNSHTQAWLGYAPRPLREAMAITVDWLRREGQIP